MSDSRLSPPLPCTASVVFPFWLVSAPLCSYFVKRLLYTEFIAPHHCRVTTAVLDRTCHPATHLAEIVEVYHMLQPTEEEQAKVAQSMKRLSDLVTSIWPTA